MKWLKAKIQAVVFAAAVWAVLSTGMTAMASGTDALSVLEEIDQDTLRDHIQEAVEELDEAGLSPSAIAWDVFGVDAGLYSDSTIGSDLISGAQSAIEETSKGFVQELFDSVMSGIGDMAVSLTDVIREKIGGAL